MARIRLIDDRGVVHAEGDIPDEEVGDISTIVRNERHYRYIGMRDGGKLTFEETNQPFHLSAW